MQKIVLSSREAGEVIDLNGKRKKSEGDKGVIDVTGSGPAGLQPASETNAIQRRRHQHEGRGGGGDRNMAKGLV